MSAESESKPFHKEMFLLVLALFFASGFSSLIYQVVWTRHLTLIFGSTTFATATVLAVFMGGLALGSFFAGRIADKISKPFLWYGILEGIIGIWALAVPVLLDISVSQLPCHLGINALRLLRLQSFEAGSGSGDFTSAYNTDGRHPAALIQICRRRIGHCRTKSRHHLCN